MSPHPSYGYFGQVANFVGNNGTEKRGRDHRRFIDCSFTGNSNRIVNDNDSNSNRKRSSSSSSSSSSSKLHRLLIRSTSSLGYDDDNDNDRKINTKESRHNKLTLLRRKFSPFAHHHHHHRTTSDPSSGNVMMNYSSSSSLPPPPSIVNTTILTTTSTMKATTTPSTVAMSSSASFFSYSDDDDDDDDDDDYDDYCEEAKNGNTDYNNDIFDDEDEESNHILSVRSPLITKLLRDELKRRDNDVVDHQDRDCDDDNNRNNVGYYSTNNTSLHIWKFTLYWSVGAFIWILVFSMPTNKYKDDVEGADDLELDRIRYTSLSIFWTRILKCLFIICTSGFVGSALGQCGNAVIEAYNTAISSYSNNDDAYSYGQNHSRRTTGDMSIDDEETGKAYHNDNDGNVIVRDDFLVLFPYHSWLLMQSLFLTVLSIATVATVASTLTSTIGVKNNNNSNNNNEYKGNNGDFVSTLYYAVFTATTAGLDGDVIISTRGKVLALLFIPLSMTTTLHWIVYIAQRYIQRTQRRKYKQQKQRRQQQERKQDAVANKHYYFDTTKIIRANSKIVVATDTYHHYRQNRAMKDDDKAPVVADNAPVVAAINNPRENGSSLFSIKDFYEVELERMGLVDIETFRVLKRKYAMRQRRQQKMLDTT